MNPRSPRRRPWGALWAACPWDGTAPPPPPPPSPSGLTVVGLPDTAPVPADGPPARRRLRTPFGALLAGAPWGGRADEPAEADEETAELVGVT